MRAYRYVENQYLSDALRGRFFLGTLSYYRKFEGLLSDPYEGMVARKFDSVEVDL